MTIRFARPDEYDEVLLHYQACNYNGGINDSDTVLIALNEGIIGAVRICTENDIKILRGMQVKSGFQRGGIGRAMLLYLVEHLDMSDCYCLPYSHLKDFYSIIGFREITPEEAPDFLAKRLEAYLFKGLDVTVMKTGATTI
jgi:N-acetylglutamate synthase-like GNAT family acetyltransferase